MPIDLVQAQAHVVALTGSVETVMQWRCINDRNAAVAAIPIVGTLAQCAATLDHYQSQGYGIFFTVNITDGHGLSNANVLGIRAAFADLDEDDAVARYQQAMAWDVKPTFAVISSPGRAHVYWVMGGAADVTRFEVIQRKLAVMFNGDPKCVDPARVLRLAGSVNYKREQPTIVTYVPVSGQPVEPGALEWHLAGVAASAGPSERVELGDGQSAPSLEWATTALNRLDPNEMDRGEWLKVSAAFKSAAWAFGPEVARLTWDLWCIRYGDNDPGENDKLWRSINATRTGWGFLARTAGIAAELAFGAAGAPVVPSAVGAVAALPGVPAPTSLPVSYGEILNAQEQVGFFNGCFFINKLGSILTPSGRIMNPQQFNGAYGGHEFIITSVGKLTDEPWKAATRGRVFRIPKLDHLRFLPSKPQGEIIIDELDRKGVNTYKPATVRRIKGDVTPFTKHIASILPTDLDCRILYSYLARNVQSPGAKIPWAPVIQSVEGAGKGVIKAVMTHAMGGIYCYSPKAKELTEGGGKFNGWMRNKLFIIVDEIRVDERRDLMEVLKPFISEIRIEMEGKGIDQEIEDNPANWIFFTNFKDAVPIDRNARRYGIMYSQMQEASDLIAAGMDGKYFASLYNWLRDDGAAIVTDWLMNYQIPAELDGAGIAQRAPETSSWKEALVISRPRIEQAIADAVEGNEVGFRNGWISSTMLQSKLSIEGVRAAGPHVIKRSLENMGYHLIGRSPMALSQEGYKQPNLWNTYKMARVQDYAKLQGYVI